MGWLCKPNFHEIIGKDADPTPAKAHIKTTQHHATLFLEACIKEYSQWFPGHETMLPMPFCTTLIETTTNLQKFSVNLAPLSFHSIFK
jgi:hypothetical protein